ncbi:hypothetical protein [Sphingobacterium zeae]|uniref:hypothetical protein n=1 Tax=Sphingobacterium zeae TaxID=1776859 RepID=UPI00361659F3
MFEDTDTIWQIHPLEGLGQIKFSMLRSEVDQFSAAIGPVKIDRSDTVQSQQAGLDELYKMFPDFFSAEDYKAVSEAITEFGQVRDDTILEFRPNGLSFEYTSGALTEIFADENCKNLQFMGVPVFLCEPVILLKELSRSLQEQPLIYQQEVIFPVHKIYLYAFVEELDERGKCQVGSSGHRSISWRDSVRPNSVELSQYHPLYFD